MNKRQLMIDNHSVTRNHAPIEKVPVGYKRTKVGIIPEDWEVKSAGNLCRVNQGLQIPISERKKRPSPTSRKYITIQYLNDGKEIEYIKDYTPSICCNEDDILMTRTGNTGIVVTGVDGVFHNNFFKINYDKKILEKDYFVSYLRQDSLQKIILSKAGTSTIPDLNHGDFYSIPIVIPPKSEQRAIAEALSDVDELISSLDKLITRKRAIKLATMQQLLTGKTRLPGFSGEWETKRLGDVLSYERPDKYIVQSTEYSENGDVPVLTANKSFILGYTEEHFGICNNLPAIVFDDFTTDNKFAYFPFKVKSSAIKLLRPKHGQVVLRFLFDRIQLIHFPLGDHKRYFISEYQNIILAIPDYEEQRAIAIVISDMDAEIVALKRRIDKTKAIKQGMMQELLTGRTRLA